MNFFKVFGWTAAFALLACSDMSDDPSNFSVVTSDLQLGSQIEKEMFVAPSDFDLKTYLEINPDVKYNQIIQAVRSKNAAFMDSMSIKDSITLSDGTQTTVEDVYKERYQADTSAFIHSDTAFTHKIFLMTGYKEDMWVSADSLNREQRGMMVRFNLIQPKTPSIAEDKKFVNEFVFDEEAMELHYVVLGALEGRAYRYCQKGEMDKPKSEIVPDTLGKAPRIMDYNAHVFCLNKEDGIVYSIK
jgi:hypothetical protein